VLNIEPPEAGNGGSIAETPNNPVYLLGIMHTTTPSDAMISGFIL
jgi:hypothetical protein